MPTIPYAVVDTQTGSIVQKFSVKKDAQGEARYRNRRSPGRYKAITVGVRGVDYDKRRNPRGQLLFRTRAAAVKYAKAHGAKKYSVRKLRTAK